MHFTQIINDKKNQSYKYNLMSCIYKMNSQKISKRHPGNHKGKTKLQRYGKIIKKTTSHQCK